MGDMVKKVADAICGQEHDPPWGEEQARAALDACHFEELVEALRFYASEGTWQCDTAPDPGFSSIPGSALSDFDHGEKARAVLAKVEDAPCQ